MMYAFIDAKRTSCGVEPHCRVLETAPPGYHTYRARQDDPTRRPARAQRDDGLGAALRRLYRDYHEVYGLLKVWH